jgi:bifunctional DNase/RNase
MDIPVELSRIIITETSPQQVIVLKEKDGERSFPIVIGVHEALAIDRRLKGIRTPRPLTHDLLAVVIKAMRGELEKIVIDDLRDSTFIAKLVIRRDGEMVEVDSRPSDAIALGAASNTPIFVADHVLEQVRKDSLEYLTNRENLEARRDELARGIAELRGLLDDESLEADVSGERKRELQRQVNEMQAELEAVEEILRHLPE